jgi:hypothetical protein
MSVTLEREQGAGWDPQPDARVLKAAPGQGRGWAPRRAEPRDVRRHDLAVRAFARLLLPFSLELDPLVVIWVLAVARTTQVVVELGGHERHVARDNSPAPGAS